jgi:hypothetical protein
LRQSGQLASQRSGTNVAVRADEQFAPKNPIFNALALCISRRLRNDTFVFILLRFAAVLATNDQCTIKS